MSRGIFITGTGTDVGKTVVTAGLMRMLRGEGLDLVSMKPVQTGALAHEGLWESPDLTVHWQASDYMPTDDERGLMAPYCYEPACSPHLAARLAGRSPDITHIVDCASQLLARHDGLLVEGAGGVLVPLDDTHTNVDLMRALAMPVVVVAHRGLGTINHTLLTLRALREEGLDVLGVIFNETRDISPDMIARDNPPTIAALGNVAVLGDVNFLADDCINWNRFASCLTGFATIRRPFMELR